MSPLFLPDLILFPVDIFGRLRNDEPHCTGENVISENVNLDLGVTEK